MRTCLQNALQSDSQNPSSRHQPSKESSSGSSIQRTFIPQFTRRTLSSYQKLHQREPAQESQPLMSHDNEAAPTTTFFFMSSSFPQSPFYLSFLSVCFSFSYTASDLVFSLTILYLYVYCFNSIFLCWGPCSVFFSFSNAATFFPRTCWLILDCASMPLLSAIK